MKDKNTNTSRSTKLKLNAQQKKQTQSTSRHERRKDDHSYILTAGAPSNHKLDGEAFRSQSPN